MNLIKDDFCSACNRIRLTAEGYLIPCLYFEDAMSIKDAVQNNRIDEAVDILKKVLQNKPEKIDGQLLMIMRHQQGLLSNWRIKRLKRV